MIKTGTTEITCNMCGETWEVEGNFEPQVNQVKGEEEYFYTWIHRINLETPGYGSFLDMCSIDEIHLCDDCLKKLWNMLEEKPNIESKL